MAEGTVVSKQTKIPTLCGIIMEDITCLLAGNINNIIKQVHYMVNLMVTKVLGKRDRQGKLEMLGRGKVVLLQFYIRQSH